MHYKIGFGWNHTIDKGNTKIELIPTVSLLATEINKGIEIGWLGFHIFLGILDIEKMEEQLEEMQLLKEEMLGKIETAKVEIEDEKKS